MIYTVDEVSVELGIPRPTVYRYLKEYSIPFSRRSGRIFVPEASVGKVRTVRELHDGGFGTEAIRTRLKQGEGAELARVTERLDKLTEVLESSRLESRRPVEPARDSPNAHALRLVLARQSLLISAVSNLAEMMGDVMAVNGLPRRAVLDYPELEHGREGRLSLPGHNGRSLAALGGRGAPNGAASRTLTHRPVAPPSNISHDKFGTLARRRRIVLVSTLFALALLAVLIWQIF